jgi:hypothetical protein
LFSDEHLIYRHGRFVKEATTRLPSVAKNSCQKQLPKTVAKKPVIVVKERGRQKADHRSL